MPDYPGFKQSNSRLENVRVRKLGFASSRKFLEFTAQLPVCGPVVSKPTDGILSFAGGLDRLQVEGEAHAVDLLKREPCSKPYWFRFKKRDESVYPKFSFETKEDLEKFISSRVSS